MSVKPHICSAILAAGQSKRFGSHDKLAASLNGKMIGTYISDTLAATHLPINMVITSNNHPCSTQWVQAGFEIYINEMPEQGMSSSIAIAAEKAIHYEVDALLICLADMPFVPKHHIQKIISTFDLLSDYPIIASHNGQNPMPPALFPASSLASLSILDGDTGARDMLRQAQYCYAEKDWLIDVDNQDMLTQHNLDIVSRHQDHR